jgi:hypothetical protein
MLPHARQISSFRFRRFVLATLAPATLAVVMAGAADLRPALAQDAAPPPALVGRIAGIEGSVSLLRSGEQDWLQAGVNEPISIGDAVYTQDGAGARLEIGATDFRLLPDTEMDVATLDDTTGQLRLDTGVVDLRVAALPTADGLLIDTPRGTVKLTQPGIYRIDAGTQDQPTSVTAWNGTAQLGTTAGVTVQQNQTLLITGTVDAPQYAFQPVSIGIPSEFKAPVRVVTESQHYVSADMTGAEDLYQYGSFRTEANYGAVWYPTNVPADWQPYRYGHWEYVAPWGQTWIDDQPWGFAPFHYGRWSRFGDRWGWVPGEYTPHPVYAPALVAFIGGGGLSAAISFGGGGGAIGWVPLGPGEAYRPPYHVNETYIQNINRTVIVNKTIVNNTTVNNFGPNGKRNVGAFANARYATVVPAAAMTGGRPVNAAVIKVQPQQLEKVSASPQVVASLPRAPASAARPAARPGPVAPVALPRGGPAPRPALPPAHGQQAGQPGRAVTPAQLPTAPNGAPTRPGTPGAAQERPAPTPPGKAEAVRPQPGQPEAGHPQPGRPGQPEAARPAPTPPTKAEPARPEAARPETARPEAARPETARPESARPPATPPHTEQARPETARPEPARPEAQRPETARPEAQHPEAKPQPRPEAARPEAARPEAARPEAARPQAQRPEARPPEPRPQQAAPRPEPKPEQRPQQAEAPRPEPHPQAAPPKPEPKKPEPKKPEDQNK